MITISTQPVKAIPAIPTTTYTYKKKGVEKTNILNIIIQIITSIITIINMLKQTKSVTELFTTSIQTVKGCK